MSVILVQDTATRLPQNLLTYSDDLDNAIWGTTRLETVVYDATYDDWIHEPTTDTGAHYTAQTLLTTLGNSDYTLSVRLRYINHRWAVLRFYDGTDVYYQSVDLLNGALGRNLNITSESITEVSTDVYDVSFTCPAVAASSISNVVIGLNNTDTLALESWTPAGTEQIGVSRVSLENYSTAGVYTKTTSAAIAGGNRVLTRLPQNLVFNSEDFSATGATKGWDHGTNDAQITSNSDAAPDGTTTADTATDSSGSLAEIVQQLQNPLAAGVQANTDYCWSIYIKKTTGATTLPLFATAWGTSSWVYGHIFIDTNDGVVYARSGSEPDSYGIESVGDYWRVWQITNPGSLAVAYFQLYPAGASSAAPSTFDPAQTGSVVIWGAQLEARPDGPGAYTATTTAAVPGTSIVRASTATYFDHNGIMQTAAIGEERTDYDPSDNSLRGLLIEEARTQKSLWSESIDNAESNWSEVQATFQDVTPDHAIAPDGQLKASRLSGTGGGSGNVGVYHNGLVVTTNVDWAYSVYLKKDNSDWVALRPMLFDDSDFSYFNLATGALGTKGASHTDYGIEDVGNGWYRCWVIYKTTTDVNGGFGIFVADADLDVTVTRDSTSSILAWGSQIEIGAAPSSYIPNDSATASVTRAADDIKITDLTQIGYNTNAGTLALTYIWPLLPYYLNRRATYFYENGDAANDRIIQYMGGKGAKTTVAYGTTGGVLQFAVNDIQALEDSLPHISVMAWATNDIGHTVDGGPVHTDSSATISATIDTLMLGADPTGALLPMNGYIAKLVYYPKRLADADLVTLSGTGTYLPTSVATADSIADALMIRLNDRGYTVGSLDDRMHQYFNAQGYAGSIQDQWRLHLDSLGYATRDLQADMMEWLEDKRPSYLGDLSDVDDLSSLWLEYLTTYEDWLQ